MTNKTVEQKPSETALFTALRRTIANKAYANSRFGPDYLAERFLPPNFRFFLMFRKIRDNTREKLDVAFPGMNAYIIARTAFFDDLFVMALKESVPQIALLGAGYDSRAYRFASLIQATRIFELDVAPTQERKKVCLKKAKINVPQGVAFVPIDFNREILKNILEKAGWQSQQKTLFIWEGVTYYLDPGSVEATLDFFSQSADPNSLLAFDYAITLTEENVSDQYGAKEFLQSMQEHHAREGVAFSIDDGKLEGFLLERNLKILQHLDKGAIESKYLIADDGVLIGQIPGYFRFVLAAPKDD
jgi:methyltransferase (TIGR00027 family)